MLWLDSTYPSVDNTSGWGNVRGTCNTTSGVPSTVESEQASAKVIFCKFGVFLCFGHSYANDYTLPANIKFGPINSTFTSG